VVVARRYASEVGSRRWIITLASLTGLVALSIDMSLPAQPTLATTFHVSAEIAALNLSLFMIAFAGVQIFIGYISDAIGRRRVMLAGLSVFTLAGIACAVSPSIEVLLVLRAIQGAGAAACPVVARAMVRDTQPAGHAARMLSTMLAVLAIAPMIAPTIGSALLDALGWRAIFGALALCGAALLFYSGATLNETLPAERRTPATASGLVRGFARFFSTRGTRLPILISCASFAGLFAYVAGSPFVLMQGYGVAREHYGLYFALTAIAIMFGSITGGRMLRAGRSPGAMIVIGAAIQVVGGGLVLAGTGFHVGVIGLRRPHGRLLLRQRHHEPERDRTRDGARARARGDRLVGDRLAHDDRRLDRRLRDDEGRRQRSMDLRDRDLHDGRHRVRARRARRQATSEAARVAIAARGTAIVRVLRLHQRVAVRARRREVARAARGIRRLGGGQRGRCCLDLFRGTSLELDVRRRRQGPTREVFHDQIQYHAPLTFSPRAGHRARRTTDAACARRAAAACASSSPPVAS
jgi:MFS transporter, DHA1 family, multidrug resistance protein